MKKSFHFLLGNACRTLLLSAFFIVAGLTSSNAQQASGSVNPESHIATRLDVTAYPLGTFERMHAIQTLQQIISQLRPVLTNNGGTLTQRLKYEFVRNVLTDTNDHFIAVEIALLRNLGKLNGQNSSADIQLPQLRVVYNEVVNALD